MNATTFGAPWGTSLIITSVVAVVVHLATSVAVYTAARFGPKLNRMLYPEREERGEVLRRPLAVLAVCILVIPLLAAMLFAIRGYTVTADAILVHRLGWSSVVALDGLESATVSPEAAQRSSRTFGNGGFFSYTGRFRNGTLGPFRAFVTDHARTVVLRFPDRAEGDRVVVMSPDDPDAFVALLPARTSSR